MVIKYRCWDKKLHIWRAPDPEHMVSMFTPGTRNAMRIVATERYEFVLWTGFEDKHGVDVYAGDILDNKYHVVWDILNGRWAIYELDEFKYDFSDYRPDQHEVTGTVFE